MSKLDELIKEREAVKKEDRRLTEEIKSERSRERWAMKQASESYDEVKKYKEKSTKLSKENVELRRLVALLMRDGSRTYKAIAETIGVSPERVTQYISLATRKIRYGNID